VQVRAVLSSLVLTLLPIVTTAQEASNHRESSTSSLRSEGWLGCWILHATDHAKLTTSDTVRLNSSIRPRRNGRTWYQGSRVPERPGYFLGSVFWLLREGGDSAEIRVEALGGTIWRVVRHADSLSGEAYSTFDAIPGEHHFGPATGRRLKC
jgi:hypothetical protein